MPYPRDCKADKTDYWVCGVTQVTGYGAVGHSQMFAGFGIVLGKHVSLSRHYRLLFSSKPRASPLAGSGYRTAVCSAVFSRVVADMFRGGRTHERRLPCVPQRQDYDHQARRPNRPALCGPEKLWWFGARRTAMHLVPCLARRERSAALVAGSQGGLWLLSHGSGEANGEVAARQGCRPRRSTGAALCKLPWQSRHLTGERPPFGGGGDQNSVRLRAMP